MFYVASPAAKRQNNWNWTYLEAAGRDLKVAASWGLHGTTIGGTQTGLGTGRTNTQRIIAGNPEPNIAARLCANYRGGGFTDWFLPSKNELDEFFKAGISSGTYWSSSEGDNNFAWSQDFMLGKQQFSNKPNEYKIRPIRAF